MPGVALVRRLGPPAPSGLSPGAFVPVSMPSRASVVLAPAIATLVLAPAFVSSTFERGCVRIHVGTRPFSLVGRAVIVTVVASKPVVVPSKRALTRRLVLVAAAAEVVTP